MHRLFSFLAGRLTLLMIPILFFLCLNAEAQWENLAYVQDYEVGAEPIVVQTAYLNGDHILDIAVANRGSRSFQILIGNGDGTFSYGESYVPDKSGWRSSDLVITDVDNDEIQDIIAVYDSLSPGLTGGISVHLGNGDGTFSSAINSTVGWYPGSLSVGDFNEDGKIDITPRVTFESAIPIYLGHGDGTFEWLDRFGDLISPTRVIVGHFDENQHLDIAVTSLSNHKLFLLHGNGDGSFKSPLEYNAGNQPVAITAFALENDSKVDIVIGDDDENNIWVMKNTGGGNFAQAVKYPVSVQPNIIFIGDLDGDELYDIVCTDYQGSKLTLLKGMIGGTFGNPEIAHENMGAKYITGADLDNDGDVDLVTANPIKNTISILLNGEPPDADTSALCWKDYD